MGASGQRLYYAGAASKIYERAARLAQLGYLVAEKRRGKTRERTYYTLSDTGLAALQAWLEEPSRFPRIQSEAVTRVFASDLAADDGAVLRSLQALIPETASSGARRRRATRRGVSGPRTPAAARPLARVPPARRPLGMDR